MGKGDPVLELVDVLVPRFARAPQDDTLKQ